ncbi:membrane-bound lytic murein transglycosylase MltF [Woeseia oceani]|uniref:membrane-bound lytic murein transglycosylase MltF n=1 Tax=Woeseia oceani TaxID=1548547 RepID=UPI0018D4CCEF|nr:membrane-bound lytic murein transglycosylase MltF [Woeseia oceani]
MDLRLISYVLVALLVGTCSSPPPLLDQVLHLGELRVVTRNAPTTYYIGQEGPAGPEFDLVQDFADELGVELRIDTVDSVAEVMPYLLSGKAHMAAAGLSVTDSRRRFADFGHPYNTVDVHLVYRLGTVRPREIQDIIGRKVEVVANSSHSDLMASLEAAYPDIEWAENADLEVRDLLEKVALGEIDLTIADSTAFNIQRHFYPDLRVALDLELDDPLAWAYRKDDGHSLLARADEFLIGAQRSGRLAQVNDRYYGHAEKFDYVGTRAFIRHFESRLPRFRPLFEQAAAETGTDWRLLAAIGYQESHWRSKAVSPTGVRGIMMLTQATADYLDIDDRQDPESSIVGGARYFARQSERLPDEIGEPDRTWLALASYNVGFNHVKDARQIVEWQGGDPNTWVDVSKALPLLARKKWYSLVDYGYARGWEPVLYVNNIRRYYNIIRWLTETESNEDSLDGDTNTFEVAQSDSSPESAAADEETLQ